MTGFPLATSRARIGALIMAIATATSTAGCDDGPDRRLETIGRCTEFNPLRTAYFGDTHVHTAASLDANTQGTRLRPADAYRFARGEEVGIQPHDAEGNPLRTLQLERPLDFVAVSDHAEFLGTIQTCEDEDAPGYDSPLCEEFRNEPADAFFGLNVRLAIGGEYPFPICQDGGAACDEATVELWREIQDAAEGAYDRTEDCQFTTFVAYEWSGAPGSRNYHRNVIFRNHIVPRRPFSYFDDNHVTALWAALREDCIDANGACDALTIPHNSNLSDGIMFAEVQELDGVPFDAEYVAEREFMEPLMEIIQHKGASECLVSAMSGDELCDFEYIPFSSLSQPVLGTLGRPQENDFARHALGRGLYYQQELSANPFHYGFVGSTDTHLATPGATSETAFPGHGGAGTSARELLASIPDIVEFNPGGLAVVWAEENSREAIFQAMRRREAYATSGPRIQLRFFGGWGYPADLCDAAGESFVQTGYDDGVPMGGTLAPRPGGSAAPTFAISALRDAGDALDESVPLQRVQVIKGFVDSAGVPQATVYEVAGDPNNGASVDTATCERSGTGFDSLCTVWTDPDFDPNQMAYYYVRVLENPSCRWSTYVCEGAGVNCADPNSVPTGFEGCCRDTFSPTIQERAWSSPIWYMPAG